MATIAEAFAIAVQHHQAGRLQAAEQIYRQILAVEPNQADAIHFLGLLAHQAGKHAIAVEYMERAIALKGTEAAFHSNLGIVFKDQRKLDEAVACYRRALELKPDFAEAHNNLGIALKHQRKLVEAVACYRRALQLKPDFAEAHNNLGIALQNQGKLGETVACYRRALELKPDYAEAHNNLGNALKDQGQRDEAVASYRRALELKPDYAAAHNNLGNALKDQGKLDQAIACHRRALELKPDCAEAHNNLGIAFKDQGKPLEALACYRRALELKPGFAAAHTNLLFTLQYCAGVTAAEVAQVCAEFDHRHAAPLSSHWRPHVNVRDPERTLRLGFVSAYFRRHPVGYFYLRTLECLREEHCQVVCYSTAVQADDFASRFRAAAHVWHEVPGLSDEALAEQIRADKVDILFDLAGHAAGNRLLVFARKPAPLQIAWAGPTGLSAMDYVLADQHLIPPGAEGDYREKTLRMPDAYACYEPPVEAPPVTSLPALDRRYVTFGSLNNLAKITPQVIDTWAQIFRRLPASRRVAGLV